MRTDRSQMRVVGFFVNSFANLIFIPNFEAAFPQLLTNKI